MPKIGDVVQFIDAHGAQHNAIVAQTRDDSEHHISIVYIDEAKSAQVFGTGAYADAIVRVIDALSDEAKSTPDNPEPKHCWVKEAPEPQTSGATLEELRDPANFETYSPESQEESEPDVTTLLEKAGLAPEEESGDPGDESK